MSADCSLEHLGGRRDQARRRGVERGDLVEHQLLVGQRLRHDHGGAQRGDRRRRGAVDTLDELDVVLEDDVDRQVALDRHRELGQQVLVLLAHVEQHVLAQRLGPLGVGRVELRRSSRRAGRRAARRRRCTGCSRAIVSQRCSFSRSSAALSLRSSSWPLYSALHDRVDLLLRALVPAEVVRELVAERDQAEQLLADRRLAAGRGPRRSAQVEQRPADLGRAGHAAVAAWP